MMTLNLFHINNKNKQMNTIISWVYHTMQVFLDKLHIIYAGMLWTLPSKHMKQNIIV